MSEAAPPGCVSARVFEFCSGQVDLVVCVGHHFGGGHRLTLAAERFVGLVAEDLAQVCDGNVHLRSDRPSVGRGGESTYGGGRFAVSEPVEQYGRDGQRVAAERSCRSRSSTGSAGSTYSRASAGSPWVRKY